MANHPDICVWFEFNKNCLFLDPISSFDEDQEEEETNEDQSYTEDETDEADEADFVETKYSYVFRVHSSFEKNCYVFSFFNNDGWQNLPFRVFLEVNHKAKMIFINFNEDNFINKISILSSDENKKNFVKTYLMSLMFPGSLCIIGDTCYRAEFCNKDNYPFFTLVPF